MDVTAGTRSVPLRDRGVVASPGRPPRSGRAPTARALLAALTALLLLALVPAAGQASRRPAPSPGGTAATTLRDGLLVDPRAPAVPALDARAWLVADLDSGDVLAAYDASTPWAPASTLKVLTALALGTGLDPDATYTARHEDAAIDGSKVGLVPGSTYRAEDLLHGLMLGSGNDTAAALAQISGGQDEAVERMQALADRLGATSTVVRNTSGLDDPAQVTTARDLAVLGRAALEVPWLADLAVVRTYAFPGEGTTFGAERPRFEIANHNRLLGRYDGALGLKNGYTTTARASFVGAAERDGRRYVATVLGAEGPSWQHAQALLDWAFGQSSPPAAVGSLGAAVPAVEAMTADGPGADPLAGTTGAAVGAPGSAGLALAVDEVDGSWWTGALRALGWVLAVLVAAVVALRTRVLLRRRRRRLGRGRRAAPTGRAARRAGERSRQAGPTRPRVREPWLVEEPVPARSTWPLADDVLVGVGAFVRADPGHADGPPVVPVPVRPFSPARRAARPAPSGRPRP